MARNSNVLVGGLFAKEGMDRPVEAEHSQELVPGWDSLTELQQATVVARLKKARELLTADAQARGSGVMGAPDDPWASLVLQGLAERMADDPEKIVEVTGTKEAQFDNKDLLGWAAGVPLAWLAGKVDKHAWQNPDLVPEALPDTARLVILGDWGSGLYGAPVMAGAIGADPRPVDVLAHLGDVYYAGTERAIRDRFLAFWPHRPEAKSRACNSNHEMYTGGHAYFDVTLPMFAQPSSAFALRNRHWLVVGLDTAYVEGDLAEDQASWLTDLVDASPNRQVILLSHHQAFSLYDPPATKALAKLEALLAAGRIHYWYWGHEHRCVLFDRHPTWGVWGRCIGHSGFPEFRRKKYHDEGAPLPTSHPDQRWLRVPAREGAPDGLVLDGPNPYVPDKPQRYVPHGYATIELHGAELVERIHDADGTVLGRVRRTQDGRSIPEVE